MIQARKVVVILGLLLLSVKPTLANQDAYFDLGKYLTIDRIIFSGNHKTKEAVLLRELTFKHGSVILRDSLNSILINNYQRLYNLNLFTTIYLQLVALEDDSIKNDVCINLKEQFFLLPQADLSLADRNINVWWKTQHHDLSRVNVGLYMQHKNLSGNIDRLSASFHLGYTKQITLAYTRPYIDVHKKWGWGIAVGYSGSKEIMFTTFNNKQRFAYDPHNLLFQNLFINSTLSYRPAYHTTHYLNLAVQNYTVGDTIADLNPNYFSNSSTQFSYIKTQYRIDYNGVDNWNYPRKGLKLIATIDYLKGLSNNDYKVPLNFEVGYFYQWHQKYLAAVIFRGLVNFNNSQNYFLKSTMGYKSEVIRGYEYYVIDADKYIIGRLDLKYEALNKKIKNISIPILPEIPIWLYPKIFFDFGYAYNNKVSNFNKLSNTFLSSIGLGIDIITAYDLKLRIEFAYNHLQEKGVYLHSNSE